MADIQLTADDHGTVFVVKGGDATLPNPEAVPQGFYARFMLNGAGPFRISYTRTLIGSRTTTLTLEDDGSWAEVRPASATWLVLTGIRDKVQGPPGPPGPAGPAPNLTIGQVTEGQQAAASLDGTPEAPVLNLVLPKPAPGPRGHTPNLTIGRVTEGQQAEATIGGSPENPTLNLTLPAGPAPNLSIGQVTEGQQAEATISGTNEAPVLNLVLPRGPQGPVGPAGSGSATLPSAHIGQTLEMTAQGWRASDAPAKTAAYVQARAANLVTNGYGTLGNNTNFRDFTFDAADCVVGGGSFDRVGVNSDVRLNEMIPVDPRGQYTVQFYARTKQKAGSSKAYFYVSCHDIDGEPITPTNLPLFWFTSEEEINNQKNYVVVAPGDRQRVKDMLAQYNMTGSSNHIWLGKADYVSRTGFVYPTGQYTRVHYNRNAAGNSISYDESTGIWQGFQFNVGHPIPPGSKISVSRSGGTYLYLIPSLANGVIPDQWQKYGTTFNAAEKLRPATAFIKLGFLMNRESQAANRQSISALSLVKNDPQNWRFFRLPPRHSASGVTLMCAFSREFMYFAAYAQDWSSVPASVKWTPPEWPADFRPVEGFFSLPMYGPDGAHGAILFAENSMSFHRYAQAPSPVSAYGRTSLLLTRTPVPNIPADWFEFHDPHIALVPGD